MEVRLKGVEDVRAKLRELPANVERNIIRAALKDLSMHVERLFKLAAPLFTGRLRFNIGIRVRTRKGVPVAFVTIQQQGKADNPNNAFYWRFLEYGTRYIKPMSFFTKTWEGIKVRVGQMLVDRIAKGVDATVRRMARRAARAAKK